MRSVLGRAFLVVAFLLAQQTAFAHQLWHDFDRTSLQAALEGKSDSSSNSNPLCEQHAALGTVLGGLNGCAAPALLADRAPEHFQATHFPVASTPRLPPASRGPPSVS